MSTPRKPSPLSQVLSAWDTKPATASSETKIAKGSIQAALGRAHESLDEARYIDGLSTVFNTYFEDTEAAITDAEAARTVNKVRLKVINLSLDTSVEFICGAYVFCIEIVKKIKTFPDLAKIFASTGLAEGTPETLLQKFKESTNQLSEVTHPETSISTPFDDLAIELNKVESFGSKELLTAYLNLVKALINTLRLSLEAYIQHLRILQGRYNFDTSDSIDDNLMKELLSCFGIDDTVYNQIEEHKLSITFPKQPNTFLGIFSYVFNYIIVCLYLYFLGQITSMEQLQLSSIQSKLKGIFFGLEAVVSSANAYKNTITKEELSAYITSKCNKFTEYAASLALHMSHLVKEIEGIYQAIKVSELLEEVKAYNTSIGILKFLEERDKNSFIDSIKQYPPPNAIFHGSDKTQIDKLFKILYEVFDKKITTEYHSFDGILKRLSDFWTEFQSLRGNSGGFRKLTIKRKRANKRTIRKRKYKRRQTLRKRKTKAKQTKRKFKPKKK